MKKIKKYLLKIVVLLSIAISISAEQKNSDLKKVDVIETVKIGTQIWMKYNLNVDHYRNGDPIPQITDNKEWLETTKGAWCYYNNDPNNGKKYGKLYNEHAIFDKRRIAPEGFHIPTREEFETLVNYLGGEKIAGGKMKMIDPNSWENSIQKASNSSNFSALPGGYRYAFGSFRSLKKGSYFWCDSYENAWEDYRDSPDTPFRYFCLFYLTNECYTMRCAGGGMSVRCIKD